MSNINSRFLLNKLWLISFILLVGLLINETVAAPRQHWNRNYMNVFYSKTGNFILIRFQIFDYHFGPANESGYLDWCEFEYSDDGFTFKNFMRASTGDQKFNGWTWVDMKNKLKDAKLEFLGCRKPENGTIWPENANLRIEVNDYQKSPKAYLAVKWYLEETYKYVRYIRITGRWHVNGAYTNESLKGVLYDVYDPYKYMFE